MKTLDDIKQDMSALYDQVRDGSVDLKVAAELANVAGKYLKAEQLAFAREVFVDGKTRGRPAFPNGPALIGERGPEIIEAPRAS